MGRELPLASSRKTVRAACPHDCPDTCAMVVHVEDGKALRVDGDKQHPFTRGGLCVKVNNFQERTHSSNRVLYPLRRSGPKGSGEFQRISWNEALGEITDRFKAIAEQYGQEAVLPLRSLGTMGILNGLNVGDLFFAKYGASIPEVTYCNSGSSTAYVMTNGPTAGVDPESVVHAKFIVIWVCNAVSTNLHWWPFVREAQKRGAKVVVIDPIRSRTAVAADQHIALRPGTDGALALAMAHVIIAEGLTDDDYIAKYTVGYDELRGNITAFTILRLIYYYVMISFSSIAILRGNTMRQMSSEQISAVLALVVIAQQLAAGVRYTLSHGWQEFTAEEAGFYNDTQRREYVPLSHGDYEVLTAASKVLATLGLAPSMMPPGLDTRRFLVAIRPAD